MILTITPNTSLDRVLFLDRLERGRRNAMRRAVDAMGGKGTDVSLILAELGIASVATGFIAGATGARIESWLRGVGVTTAFVPVAGESRVNTVLIEAEGNFHTTLCPEGLIVAPADVTRLTATALEAVSTGDVVVVAGSLPAGVAPDLYATWLRLFRVQGIRVILDSSGPSLIAGAAALPWALKPNREELETLAEAAGFSFPRPNLDNEAEIGLPVPTMATAAAAVAREWVRRGVERVLASLGSAGAVAVDGAGAWYAPPLDVRVLNPAGAGDAMVAAIAMAAKSEAPLPEVLRSAVALASAVVMTERTAECHREDYERLRSQVSVEEV